MGPIFLAAMFLAFSTSKEWQLAWFFLNGIIVAVYLLLTNYYNKRRSFLSVIISLPLVLFLFSVIFGFFDLVDDSFILLFLYSMVLSPIFITLEGFFQPRKI